MAVYNIRRKMISAFYKSSPSKGQKITRQKWKVQAFMIPKQHLIDNEDDISKLKKQRLKYQKQFTFIQNQIEREARLKKQNNREHFQINREQLQNALHFKSQYQNREARRKELGITSRELRLKEVRKGCNWFGQKNGSRLQGNIILTSNGIGRKINQQI